MKATLVKIKNGDRQSLEQIINETYPKIYSYILRRLRNVTVSKDLTQETFLRMMNHLYGLSSDTKIEHYLYRIAYHLCMDYYRIHQRETEEMETESHDPLPMDVILKKEKQESIKYALSKLSEEQKDVILLKYYQDLKIKEIAFILNENENTVKTRLRLGIKKLKKILEKGEIDEY